MSTSAASPDPTPTVALVPPLDLEVRVRYCECDPMNVAHHSVYLVWMEMARCELLRRDFQSYRELEAQGIFFVVARLAVRYRRPIRYDDLIRVRTWLTQAGRVKLEHAYEFHRGRELLATAETTIACVGRDGRPRPIPAELLPAGDR